MSGNDQCQMCHIYFPQVYFFNMHSTIRRNENIVLKKCAEASKSPYSVQILKNTDQKKTPYLETFHAVCLKLNCLVNE